MAQKVVSVSEKMHLMQSIILIQGLFCRKNESLWIYYKKLNERSHHGNVGDGVFNVVSQSSRAILIHQVPNNLKILFVCPSQVFASIHSKSVSV